MNLKEIIESRLADDSFKLPIISHTALRLQRLVSSPGCDITDLVETIQTDQSLAVHVLNTANAPFFSGLKRITNLRDAIVRIGTREVLVLVITVTQKNLYRSRNSYYGTVLEKLWEHALGTAMAARWLGMRKGMGARMELLFLGGLLHDVGKLVLVKILEDLQRQNGSRGPMLSTPLIEEVLESMHTTVGSTMLEKQMLPEVYCRIARDHHVDEEKTDDTMDIIRFANLACRKRGLGLKHDGELVLTATPCAERLGLNDIDVAELEVAMDDMVKDIKERV
jgi:putative nucleotidyltransferase with HDIG domain